jgi:hypothetical protein
MNKKYDGNGSVREHLIFLSKLSIGIREQVRKFEEDLLVNIAVISLPKVCNTFKVNDNAKEELLGKDYWVWAGMALNSSTMLTPY